MKIKTNIILLTLLIFIAGRAAVFAAVGCDLNDPDRDVKRLFPGSTGFKTNYMSLDKKGGDAMLAKIEERLGDKFSGLFETADVPYTVYEIYIGKELTGYIHGVNQKGKYGGLQVFLVLDKNGVITNFYYQKMTSREAKILRDAEFGKQFKGLNLKDFYNYDIKKGKAVSDSRVAQIKNPAPKAEDDFRATLRAVKKNLILMDEFVFGNKYLQYLKSN
jgi:hypothetical protein